MSRTLTLGQTQWVNNTVAGKTHTDTHTPVEKYGGNYKEERLLSDCMCINVYLGVRNGF